MVKSWDRANDEEDGCILRWRQDLRMERGTSNEERGSATHQVMMMGGGSAMVSLEGGNNGGGR